MVLLPQPTKEEIINDLIESKSEESYSRDYLGYSQLGGNCKRAIWYNFRWCKLNKTSARMQRLFKRGDWEEDRIIADLEAIGVEVYGQQKTVKGLAGHIYGHIDGLAENVPGFENQILLLEFKTANQKRYEKFKKDGIKKTAQHYYYQAISYMGKLNLQKCLFIVTNKNDESRWMKIIDFNDEEFSKIEHIGFQILSTDIPPERIGLPTWYECKFCHYKDICHEGEKILKSCRSCQHGTIEDEGVWKCGLTDKNLSIEDQKKACDQYLLLKDMY